MITLCTVTLDTIPQYEKILIESVLSRTKLISEVVIAQNDHPLGEFERTWEERGIKFVKYSANEGSPQTDCGSQHGMGLNSAIDKATNDLVLWCDPDVFFYTAAEEFYLKIMEKHGLNCVGCSHHSATELAQTFFPWHGQLLVRKSDLPPKTWLKDHLHHEGKYLVPHVGHHMSHLYPNGTGNFDTSCGLWLWAHEQNWKWLSFQTHDAHVYTTKYYRGNTKISEKFPNQKLIFHGVSGSIELAKWEPFQAAYEESKEDE